MSLARHVSPSNLIDAAQEHSKKHGSKNIRDLMQHEGGGNVHEGSVGKDEGTRYDINKLPKFRLPHKGTDPALTYSLIHDELTLDGTPLLNLASFVHTSMHPEADKLILENMSKNLIDQDEYPSTTTIHDRCISMVASLWNAPTEKNADGSREQATGTATTGSSEAIQLAGLAMKTLWQERMRKAGKDEYRPGPNIIMGANAQVALEKFARYFDVEARLVPVTKESNYCLDPKKAMEYVDENTIGVFVIMGSTYTGHYEPVQEMSDLLDAYEAKTGVSIPIHVDGASGAFYAPFASPKLIWDFRIKRVVSINASGHKWGATYVGCGFAIWRDKAHLPKSMIFELHYLGSIEYSFSLNFSRPAAPIIAQYFNFIHFGFEGYRKISHRDAKNARLFARAIENSKYYEVVSAIHRPAKQIGNDGKTHHPAGNNKQGELTDDIEYYEPCLPVVAFKFSEEFVKEFPHVQQKWIQTLLRSRAWIVPNYNLPEAVEGTEILRVVMREGFTEDLVEKLVMDLMEITESLMKSGSIASDADSGSGKKSTSTQDLVNSLHETLNISGGRGQHKIDKHASRHDGGGSKASGHDTVC